MINMNKSFYRNKRIWLFMDKIESADDNAEHLYRHSIAKDDGIKKYFTVDSKSPDFKRLENLKAQILNHKTGLKCPICGEPLITRIAKMYDLDDNLVLQPKAHCVKCVFQIKE